MNQLFLVSLAFIGGVFLAAQGGLNASLGVLLKNPLLASVVAFISSAVFAIFFALLSANNTPSLEDVKGVPLYLWFVGGLLSVLGISLYYYTIPKLGMSTMISIGLCGQLVFASLAGQLGWFNLPIEPLTIKRSIGMLSMILGIILINLK